MFVPCLVAATRHDGAPRLGHRLLDDYLAMVAARCRPNTVLATASDLKVFFTVVGKDPAEVTDADVLSFIRAQRQPRRGVEVVRIEDGEAGLSARTINRTTCEAGSTAYGRPAESVTTIPGNRCSASNRAASRAPESMLTTGNSSAISSACMSAPSRRDNSTEPFDYPVDTEDVNRCGAQQHH